MKYLEINGLEEIPPSAGSVYQRKDQLRQYVTNLDLTVQWYNKVRATVLEVEFPLIEAQLREIDTRLQLAETTLTWNSEGGGGSFRTFLF